MDKQNNKLTTNLDLQTEDRRSLIIGGVLVLLIAISPLLFYSYKNFPETKIWETSFFTVSTSFQDWFSYAWYVTGKLIPLYLLFIWFFTCKHWWYWIILVPISMYSFQLWGLIIQSNSIDENELLYILPIMMVIVPTVYVIRAKLFANINKNDLKSFEEELGQKQSIWQQIKGLFR